MKSKTERRNFLKKSMLLAGGFFSMKLVSGKSFLEKETVSSTNRENITNDTIRIIQDLRTTHGNFSGKEIPDAEIELIKQSCIRAANASNMQTYSIIVIRDKALMKKTCGYVGSCMMLFCVDYNRLIDSAGSIGLPYYPGNLTSFVTGSINTSLAAQTAVIAARSLGIDSLLTNGIHRGDMQRHWDMLSLPEQNCMPLIALVLGYADNQPEYKMGRLTGKEIFHDQSYKKPTPEELKEITLQYDDPSIHMGLNENWKEKGYQHYLEWLFKEWLGRDSKPTEKETQIFSQLKKRGFVEMIK